MKDKHTAILEAAITLFSKNGFWNTSTTQVTKEAGVGTGTLFNYFAGKDALISEVLLKLKLEAIHHMQQGLDHSDTIEQQMSHIWTQGIEWAVYEKERCDLMDQLESSEYITKETYDNIHMEYAFLQHIFNQGIEEKQIADIDPYLLMKTMLLQGRAISAFIKSRNMPKKEITEYINLGFTMFWKSISP